MIRAQAPTAKRRDLEETDERFEAFQDLADTWVVWDCNEGDFAKVGTCHLCSLDEARAKAFCSLLNRLLGSSLISQPPQ